MATVVTLLYPIPDEGPDAFNTDYYLSTHLQLGLKAWTQYGLKKWSVVKLAPETGYVIQTLMLWESAEGVGQAMKEKGEEVLGDLKNFSTKKPVVYQGVVAAGTLE